MTFCYLSTGYFSNNSIEETITTLEDAGFTNFEISGGKINSSSITELKKYRARGMNFLLHNYCLTYGNENFVRDRIESSSKRHRRSIFISKNVLKNEKITTDNIAVVRPSNGIHPKFYKKVIGKKFKNNKKKGTPLKFEYVN